MGDIENEFKDEESVYSRKVRMQKNDVEYDTGGI